MQKVTQAAFTIESYKVRNFAFSEPLNPKSKGLDLRFSPSGKYYPEEGKFVMDLKFEAIFDLPKSNPEILMTCAFETIFKFSNFPLQFDEIPAYFYKNSLGIVFPYMRAFVSTLTFQANIRPVVLPLLNLTTLEEEFKKNTKVL